MQTQDEEQNKKLSQSYSVNTHHNQDKVLKESFNLFKGGSLDFLDTGLLGEVTEILNTEITETTTKKAYVDNALKMSTNKGVHHEWEVKINSEDMKRFASYHIDLSRMHNIDFTTIIITTQKPGVTSYTSPSMIFTPKIINLKERDADKTLVEIDRKLKAGENINELEIIYLPLYDSKGGKTTSELLDIAIKLTPKVVKDDKTDIRERNMLPHVSGIGLEGIFQVRSVVYSQKPELTGFLAYHIGTKMQTIYWNMLTTK